MYLSSKIVWAICCNFGCSFCRHPGLSTQHVSKQPRISKQVEKFSALPWVHTLASKWLYKCKHNSNFFQRASGARFPFFFFFWHWLLCNMNHCTVRVNKRDSLQNHNPDLKQGLGDATLSFYVITETWILAASFPVRAEIMPCYFHEYLAKVKITQDMGYCSALRPASQFEPFSGDITSKKASRLSPAEARDSLAAEREQSMVVTSQKTDYLKIGI